MILSALEAAGEMKCVRLKVLLGRCYELLYSGPDNHVPELDDDFDKELLEAIR